ncbi:ribosomal protein L15 [Ceratocystis lukuohia]|uniref:54S ribosomal protein L10 mitochondrial n=2 Tax=Ceratocystis TaxID=5157 RepID=A0A0F8B019_CERFI|nr:54S ribosomal protein L10 mitochondrial [Ceratocystis platani]
MPPRLSPLTRAVLGPAPTPTLPATTVPLQLTSLLASLSLNTNARPASILSRLRDAPGAKQNTKRVGRGPSSGYGRTSGRGMNGQKVHGKVKPWFQGGQTPLVVSRGTRGFDNIRAAQLSTINLDSLQHWIDTGRLDPSKQITVKEIIESGLVGSVKDGIKLLGRGKSMLRTPVNIMVSRASTEAIEAIEAVGGRIITRYYTKDSIRNLLKGKSISSETPLPVGAEHVAQALADAKARPWLKRLPDPTHRWDVEYYRDPAHRGYLSHMLKEGENPSLFFGVPKETKPKKKRTGSARAKAEKDDLLF